MVTAPLLAQGVDLPNPCSVRILSAGSDHLALSIKKDGGMCRDEYDAPFGDLRQPLPTLMVSRKKQLSLRAGKDVAAAWCSRSWARSRT